MHHGLERDYRFLLARIISGHPLSAERSDGVLAALRAGVRSGMLREAWLALEELAARRVFDRCEPIRRNGEVHVTYTERSGLTRITLEMRDEEWRAVAGVASEASEIIQSVLAGIISALSLNDSPTDVASKIASILELSRHVETGAAGYLVLFREVEIPSIREGGRIGGTTLSEAKTNGLYGAALSTAGSHLVVGRERFSSAPGLFAPASGAGSILLFPLRSAGHLYGTMEIHAPGLGAPPPGRLTNYYLLAKGILRLLDNNRHLERMVAVDRLTGVNNRNCYEKQLPLEMERATRSRKCLAFLMIDIDDFKLFNDNHGHDTGDRVLRLVAQTVKKHLRKIDHLFRFGGEEFIVLLPGAGRGAAQRTAERIREVVSKTRLALDTGVQLGITVTIGGCIYPLDAGDEVELFRKADQAMIRAKREGKNRVLFIGD